MNFHKFNRPPTASFLDKLFLQENGMPTNKHPLLTRIIEVVSYTLLGITYKSIFFWSNIQLMSINIFHISWATPNLKMLKIWSFFFPYFIWSVRNRFEGILFKIYVAASRVYPQKDIERFMKYIMDRTIFNKVWFFLSTILFNCGV